LKSSLFSSHFFLSEEKVLVKGAKHSILLDFEKGKIYRANSAAENILELGERGASIGEALSQLGSEIKCADITSFIEEASSQGLLTVSQTPQSQPTEQHAPLLDFLWIEVTSRCNLKCIHCYADAKAESTEEGRASDLSGEEIWKIIDEAASLGCQKIQFTGGEPTLRPDLEDLMGHALDRGFKFVEIFTNGTMLTEKKVNFFAEKGINVALSIYCHRAKEHDAITGVPGSFERTLNSLKLLLAYEVPTRCAVIAMKQNEEELEQTSYFLSKLGVLRSPPDPVRPSGRGVNTEIWPNKYGLRSFRTHAAFVVNREVYNRNRNWNSCWFGKAAVTSTGEVLPCIFARDQVAGNIRHQSFSEIVYGHSMLNYWSLTKDRVEVCSDCEFRYVCEDCRPWAYGFTGNLYAKSPRCTYDPYLGEWSKDGIIPPQAPYYPAKIGKDARYTQCP
jgi:radical SAM protein with 4Fe4S-binding SPASM domain